VSPAFSTNVPEKDEDKPFYALGMSIATQVAERLGDSVNFTERSIVVSGFAAATRGSIPEDQKEAFCTKYGPIATSLIAERLQSQKGGETKRGEEFVAQYMEENPSAVQLPSGLVFNELSPGKGATALLSSTVTVHYHGQLADGTVFDSSIERDEPVSFPLSNVIKGWQEGVQRMSEGAVVELLCPPDLAYGEQGSPPVIPGSATLKFKVILMKVGATESG
jgi:FKBP-type peptidyl-prolyl cis-trans isomerase